MIIGGITAFLIIALLITSLVFLLHPGLSSPDTVARIRDVFIIFMAFESLLIGGVLVILIVQLARLTNLLQNEIKPILDSTNETVSTLRGTTQFVSEHLSEPIIKLNEYVAALQKLLDLFRLGGNIKK
jgi:membrane protein implicated in regulation of membrane protease activity